MSAFTLLPKNSVTWELVIETVARIETDRARQLAGVLQTLWEPWTAPASELPWLAWAWSVDIWDDAWPEARKRKVIAESPAFHRLKGTIAADRMACAYVDAELISYHLPRDGFAVSRAPTPAQYQAWLTGLPELRIYPLGGRPARLRQEEPEPILAFPPMPVVGRTPVFRIGQIGRARRAELRQGNRVVELVVSGETRGPDGEALSEIERVSIPRAVQRTLAVGRTSIGTPIGPRPSTRRVFSFDWRPSSTNPFDLHPGVPSLVPVEATPRKVAIPKPHRPHRLIVGRTPVRSILGFPPARENYYLALRLADGSGPSGQRPRQGAVGRDRLPRAKYTKELSVLLARPVRRGAPFSGSRIIADPEPKVRKVLEAIGTAQAARDRVFVNFNVVRELTVADLDRIDAATRVGERRLMPRR